MPIGPRLAPGRRRVARLLAQTSCTPEPRRTLSAITASTCARRRPAASMPGSSSKDGREMRVRVDGQLTFNTSIAMIDAAIAGYGIAYVPEDLLRGSCRRRAANASPGGMVSAFCRISFVLPEPSAAIPGVQSYRRCIALQTIAASAMKIFMLILQSHNSAQFHPVRAPTNC